MNGGTCARIGRRWPSAAALAVAAALGFGLGAFNTTARPVAAQPPAPAPAASDYSQRVVAYVHGNIAITREMLGEYLIARYGTEKVDLLVNKTIIEHSCKQRGVEVTAAEIEAALDEDLKPMNIDRATFVKHLLKEYHKTLYEWKEDVIRPRLQLTKLCRSQIQVTDEELKKAFEATYGEKAKVRMIMWPNGEEKVAMKMYDAIRSSEAEFDRAARQQANSTLAASGGRISPIGRGAAENPLLEQIAFKLREGEVSELVKTAQGVIVLKSDGRDAPQQGRTFEGEKANLYKMVFDQKVGKAIPVMFQQMQTEAKPVVILKHGTTDQDVIKAAEEEFRLMNYQPPPPPPPIDPKK